MTDTRFIHLAYGELNGGQLPQHQAEGIAFMAQATRTLCGDPVGAGKTVQAAGLIAHLVEVGVVDLSGPVLWLTEGTTLAEQTEREPVRFLPTLTVRNLAGHRDLSSQASEPRKRAAIAEPDHVKIMTFSLEQRH
jgi:superfamily II DNA or RNA helicase